MIILRYDELIVGVVWLFSDQEKDSCDPRAYCPPECDCTGTVLRCNNRDLTEVPQDIPLDTTELYVTHLLTSKRRRVLINSFS